MRCGSVLAVTVIAFGGVVALAAEAPSRSSSGKEATYEGLESLGLAARQLEEVKDNQLLYEQRCRELIERAKAFEGKRLRFSAVVQRVTHEEVVVDLPDAGRTRVVLRHAQPPFFGALRSREYAGAPSADRLYIFARPTTLRLGSEIDSTVAQKLRHGNGLLLAGEIRSMVVRLDRWHDPFLVAVISLAKILGVTEEAD